MVASVQRPSGCLASSHEIFLFLTLLLLYVAYTSIIISMQLVETMWMLISHATDPCHLIVHIRGSYPFYCHTYLILTFTDELMNMVRHQAISIKDIVSSRGGTIRLIRQSHHIQGIKKLVIVLLLLKNVLVIYTTHHHVINSCPWSFSRLSWHLLTNKLF